MYQTGNVMCAQMEVLRKIRKKGKVNGYVVDLAEAQAKDYMVMKHRLDNIETDVSAIKTDLAVVKSNVDLIVQRMNSPVEQERKDGMIWREIRAAIKSWRGWAFIIFFLICVALAGDKLLQILNWLPTGA